MMQDLTSRVASLRLEKGIQRRVPSGSPVPAGIEFCAIDPSEDPGAKGPCARPRRPGGGAVTSAEHARQDLAGKEGLRCPDYWALKGSYAVYSIIIFTYSRIAEETNL